MRHEKFERDFHEFVRIGDPDKRQPGPFRRSLARIARLFFNRRPDLRDFSDEALRDIGLTRIDIERW
jgi:uncharacterized protein YjiS (DUF1127 family)